MVFQQYRAQAVFAGIPRMDGKFVQDSDKCGFACKTVPFNLANREEGKRSGVFSEPERKIMVYGYSFGTVLSNQGNPLENGPQSRLKKGCCQGRLLFDIGNGFVGEFHFRISNLYSAFPGPVLIGFLFDFQEYGVRLHIFPEPYLEPGPGTIVVCRVEGKIGCVIIQGIIMKRTVVTDLQNAVLVSGSAEKVGQFGGVEYKFGIRPVHQLDGIHFPERNGVKMLHGLQDIFRSFSHSS